MREELSIYLTVRRLLICNWSHAAFTLSSSKSAVATQGSPYSAYNSVKFNIMRQGCTQSLFEVGLFRAGLSGRSSHM